MVCFLWVYTQIYVRARIQVVSLQQSLLSYHTLADFLYREAHEMVGIAYLFLHTHVLEPGLSVGD